MQTVIAEATARLDKPPDLAVGSVTVALADVAGDLGVTELLITRQGSAEGAQQSVVLVPGEDTSLSLSPGQYAVTVKSAGRVSYVHLLEVLPCEDVRVVPDLSTPRRNPTFEERLHKYGLAPADIKVEEISVEEGKTIDLTDPENPFREAAQQVTIDGVDRAKDILGVPDEYWPEGFSRYGDVIQGGDDVRHALREYMYGNSRTVADWRDRLDEFVRDTMDIPFPVFAVRTVTIGRCGLLRIGRNGLSCDVLRMHPTATIKVLAGPAHIETGVYEGL